MISSNSNSMADWYPNLSVGIFSWELPDLQSNAYILMSSSTEVAPCIHSFSSTKPKIFFYFRVFCHWIEI